jgi:hypothetical protein
MAKHDEVSVPVISVTLEGAEAATGLSRTKLYEFIKGEKLTARKADGRTILEMDELRRLIRSLPAIGKQPATAAA